MIAHLHILDLFGTDGVSIERRDDSLTIKQGDVVVALSLSPELLDQLAELATEARPVMAERTEWHRGVAA